jgi:hypothetical protein
MQEHKLTKFQIMLRAKHTSALENLLKNKDFRFYMSELLGYCKTFENAFDEKGNVAAWNNGRQDVGQKIYNDIMAVSPEQYLAMCKEEAEYIALKDQMDKGEANAKY